MLRLQFFLGVGLITEDMLQEKKISYVSLRWKFCIVDFTSDDILRLNVLACKYIAYASINGTVQGFVIFEQSKRIKGCKSLIPKACWSIVNGRSEWERDALNNTSMCVVERGNLPTYHKRAMAGWSAKEQRKKVNKQRIETENQKAQDQLIQYLDPIDCNQSEFSTTYNWLVRDGISVDGNLWRPYSSSKLWPRQFFLINPVYKALSAIEIITDHQKEYWTQFGTDTTPPQDSVGWTAMIDRIIVQPAVSKLLTLQVNNLVPFSVEALHYKSGEPTTGYHKDPPAYKAIACLTLEGSGSISIGNRKSTKETSRELGRGESYLLLGDAVEKWQHRVGLEKSGDRVVLVVRFVERAIMEAIITIRDADLIMQKPHRFPKRARKA